MQLVTKPLAEQITDLLRTRIVSGQLPPESRLDIDLLAGEFGVSVTPVRDALRTLERDRLLVIRPRRGVFVAPVEAREIREVFDARIALECLATETATSRIPAEALERLAATYARAAGRLAALRPDDAAGEESILGPSDSQLHDLIVEHCDNRVVRELMYSLRDRVAWARRAAVDRAHRYRLSFEEHQAVLERLQARDARGAVREMRRHLTRSRDQTLAALSALAVSTPREDSAERG